MFLSLIVFIFPLVTGTCVCGIRWSRRHTVWFTVSPRHTHTFTHDSSVQANHSQSCVCDPAFSCHDSGATVLALASKQQLLISGGRKGWISVLDLSLKVQRQSFQAHDSPVKALAVDATEGSFISGSAEGNIKV